MKGIFKLIPAALAVFALASCSTDELEVNNAQKQDVATKGDLRMSWDAFDNETLTRAMRDDNFGTLTFKEDDQVNVYSEDLYNTDWYTFQEDAFYYANDDDPMVTAPKFGVMPGEMVRKAYIDRATRTTRVDMEIPKTITYNSESETTIDGKAMYACDLPAFGYASLASEGYVEVANLRYMTAILKINLEKVVSNASWLRLINYGQDGIPATGTIGAKAKPLSGIFTAELYSDPAERKNVKLAALDEDLAASWAPYIFVDLRSVPSNTTCIYIPVVAGLDGDLDNIRLEYATDLVNEEEAIPFGGATGWKAIPGMAFPGKEFKQHSRYSGSYAFEFADMTPDLVSGILTQYQATSADIDIDITNSFTIQAGVANIGNEILLPAFENDVNVNITLGDAFAAWNNANPDGLIIRDADPENPFTGTITININGNGADLAAANADMEINLAEGTAVIAGEFTNASALTLTSGDIVIGDGTTTTSGLSWAAVGDNVKSIEIAAKATVASNIDCSNADNKTKSVIVAGDLTGDIKASPAPTADEKTTITVSGKLTQVATAIDGNGGIFVDVNVSGQVIGDIDLKDAVKGKIKIEGGKAADADATVVTGNVTMKGDVEVALTAEGEAISGTLKMLGAAKTLKLVQGYIKEIEVSVNNAGSWEDKYIDVVLDQKLKDDAQGNPVYGSTAFLTLTETEGVAKFTKNIWNGNKITNATYKNKKTTAYGQDKNLFTACQFASIADDLNGILRLANNLDLNNKAWKGIKKGDLFEGLKVVNVMNETQRTYPTIENLNLTANGGGLFAETNADATVKNITISGVTAKPTVAAENIGAIYGTAAHKLTVENVSVTGIDIVATAPTTGANAGIVPSLKNVGGIVGSSKALNLDKVSVAGAITGYQGLGGFVGKIAGAAVIGSKTDGSSKCSSTITLAANYNSNKAMDMNYARMGAFIGTIADDANVTIGDNSTCTGSSITGKPDKMYLSDTTAGDGNFFDYTQDQNFIGFSGTYKHTSGDYIKMYGTIKINSNTVTTTEPYFGTAAQWQGDKTKTMASKNQAPLYHFTQQQ